MRSRGTRRRATRSPVRYRSASCAPVVPGLSANEWFHWLQLAAIAGAVVVDVTSTFSTTRKSKPRRLKDARGVRCRVSGGDAVLAPDATGPHRMAGARCSARRACAERDGIWHRASAPHPAWRCGVPDRTSGGRRARPPPPPPAVFKCTTRSDCPPAAFCAHSAAPAARCRHLSIQRAFSLSPAARWRRWRGVARCRSMRAPRCR